MGFRDTMRNFGNWIGEKIAEDRQKIGGMHAPAMGAKGMEELRAAFSMGGNIEQPTNPGILGTWTPGEVAAERNPSLHAPEEEASRRMERVINLQEAKEAITTLRNIEKEVKAMPPDQRCMAENFIRPPQRDRGRGR